jgi:hypothetical protein
MAHNGTPGCHLTSLKARSARLSQMVDYELMHVRMQIENKMSLISYNESDGRTTVRLLSVICGYLL